LYFYGELAMATLVSTMPGVYAEFPDLIERFRQPSRCRFLRSLKIRVGAKADKRTEPRFEIRLRF